MKIIRFIFISILFLLSCIDNPIDPYDRANEVYSIGGKIERWYLGNDKNVIFIGAGEIWNSDKIYSSSSIDSNGNFMLKNLDNPTKIMFMNPTYPLFPDSTIITHNTLSCSDSSAKQVWGHLVITLASDSTLDPKGHIYRRNFNDWFYFSDDSVKSGDFYVEYIYSDKNVILKGNIEYIYNNIYYDKIEHFTLMYDLILKEGWNKKVTLIKSQEVTHESSLTKIIGTRSISNHEPEGAIWDFNYYHNR